jgi:hypothetical protein
MISRSACTRVRISGTTLSSAVTVTAVAPPTVIVRWIAPPADSLLKLPTARASVRAAPEPLTWASARWQADDAATRESNATNERRCMPVEMRDRARRLTPRAPAR